MIPASVSDMSSFRSRDQDSSSDNGEAEETRPLNEYVVVPGEPFPPTPGPQDKYLVTFAEDDPERPMNWPMWQRIMYKAIATMNITVVTWGSSAISPGISEICEEFHVGQVTGALTVSLYVAGFATGPIFWGPSSEMLGRHVPLVIGVFGFCCFGFACATCKDFQTLMLGRFFMGTFGVSTISVGPAISADVFTTSQRGKAISYVILAIICGPVIAPVVSGYIANSYLHWRWTMYITSIMGCLALVIQLLLFKETYPQTCLRNRAVQIRAATGNWAVSAPIETMELDTKNILHRTILKPFRMLLVEPILLLMSLYHGFIYGILYLCLTAVPIVFQEQYGWKGGNVYLPYLGMFIGCVILVVVNLLVFDKMTERELKRNHGDVAPETRLPLMMMSGVAFAMGIFLTFWSGAYPQLPGKPGGAHWIAPTIGLALIGFGLIGIFQAILIYIIDTYLLVAASAIAANTFVRSGMAAAFPLFAAAMFHNLGVQWAGTLLGCLAAVLAPVPFFFYFYGKKIRAKSMYAVGDDNLDLEDLELEIRADPATRNSHAGSSVNDISRVNSRTAGAL